LYLQNIAEFNKYMGDYRRNMLANAMGQMDHGLRQQEFNRRNALLEQRTAPIRNWLSNVGERANLLATDPVQALANALTSTYGFSQELPTQEQVRGLLAQPPRPLERNIMDTGFGQEAMSMIPGPADNIGGLIGMAKTPRELFERSQVSGKRAKNLKGQAKQLRDEIRSKREERRLGFRRPGVGLDQRLRWHKEGKSKAAKAQAISGHMNAQYWTKAELDAINKAVDIDHNIAGEISKANLKAAKRNLIKQGWEPYHTSTHQGRTSSYYLQKDGKTVRISDHSLPDTPERAYNTQAGLRRGWDYEIEVDADTDINRLFSDYE
jgi:hypothetical protein